MDLQCQVYGTYQQYSFHGNFGVLLAPSQNIFFTHFYLSSPLSTMISSNQVIGAVLAFALTSTLLVLLASVVKKRKPTPVSYFDSPYPSTYAFSESRSSNHSPYPSWSHVEHGQPMQSRSQSQLQSQPQNQNQQPPTRNMNASLSRSSRLGLRNDVPPAYACPPEYTTISRPPRVYIPK